MQRFRLVRFDSTGALDDLAYLQSLAADGSPVFTADRGTALLMSWNEFVSCASSVWLASGPIDIFPDPVFVLPTGGCI